VTTPDTNTQQSSVNELKEQNYYIMLALLR